MKYQISFCAEEQEKALFPVSLGYLSYFSLNRILFFYSSLFSHCSQRCPPPSWCSGLGGGQQTVVALVLLVPLLQGQQVQAGPGDGWLLLCREWEPQLQMHDASGPLFTLLPPLTCTKQLGIYPILVSKSHSKVSSNIAGKRLTFWRVNNSYKCAS